MLYDYERLWHCRMRCAVVHYAVCMWAAHLAVFMYGCAIVYVVGGTPSCVVGRPCRSPR